MKDQIYLNQPYITSSSLQNCLSMSSLWFTCWVRWCCCVLAYIMFLPMGISVELLSTGCADFGNECKQHHDCVCPIIICIHKHTLRLQSCIVVEVSTILVKFTKTCTTIIIYISTIIELKRLFCTYNNYQ